MTLIQGFQFAVARGAAYRISMANALTLARLALIGPFVAAMLFGGAAAGWAAFGIFLLAALTDFADGRIARARGEVTALGAALDPIADKALAAAALVLLVGTGAIAGVHLVAATAILVREFLVSGLREAIAGDGESVPTTFLSKAKTVVQFIALAVLLAPLGSAYGHASGLALLWLAAALTVWTGTEHAARAVRILRKH